MEPIEMRSDVDLLLTILDSPCVVNGRVLSLLRKVLAQLADISVQTLSDYTCGKTNIPVAFWRRLFELTRDPRIPTLITGTVDCELLIQQRTAPETTPDYFKRAVEESGAHHEKQSYIAEMLADGRIDELDASTVQAYDDAYLHHRCVDAQLHRAIVHKFNCAMQSKGAPS